MLFLRSLVFYLGMWIITVPYGLLVVLVLPLKPINRYRFLTTWGRAVMFWLRVTCDIRYEVEGREHIPGRASVILAKHQSTWETIGLQSIFPAQTWVLKRELLRIPIFGWGLWACWAVAIDRAAGKEALRQVVEQGKERLANGFWMVVFPEGTRMAPGARGKYAIGGAMLAEKAGVAVVPVAHNAGEHWPKGGFLKFPGTIKVVIGPAIETEGRKASEVIRLTEEWIEGQMARISTPSGA